MDSFDLIIIGGGPAGYVAAIRAAQLGLKTACIEKRKTLGGTCLNVGCIPSKAMLDSSEHYHFAKSKLQRHGVIVGDVKLDLPAMLKRKEAVVRQLTTGIGALFKKNKVEFINGFGKLAGQKDGKYVVEVKGDAETKQITASKILLATGSEPASLPSIPFDGKTVVSSTEALEFNEVPKHLVVIGGGVIGLELGSVWLRLGAKVTVVEFGSKLLGTMDPLIAGELHKSLTKQGFEFRLGTKCISAVASGSVTLVETEEVATGTKSKIECDKVLVSVGRRPYTENLGLESVGITKDKQGRVEINDHFETTAKGIYAIGDLVRGPMLAHKAEDEGIAAAEIMAGQKGHVNYDAIPNVIYTWPEVASVGSTDEELKKKGIEIKSGTFMFMNNGRAKAMDEVEGLVKITACAKTDRVLGVHIVGPRASDMIAECVSVIEFGGSAEDIARTCHAHPTLSEIVKEAALAVDKRAIHI